MSFRRFASIFLLLSLTAVHVAAQQDTGATIEVAPFFGGSFKAGQWLPLRVTASNDGPDRQALVRAGTGTGASYDTPVELPRGARKALVVYVRPEGFARSVTVRLLEGERELARTDVKVDGWSGSTEAIGLLASRPLVAPHPVGSRQIPVATLQFTLDDLPPRAEGLSSFAALVVDGVPLDGLSTAQATALDDWVRSGGQLVVGTGADPRTLQTLPDTLRIASHGAAAPQSVQDTVLAALGPDARITAVTLKAAAGAMAIDPLAVQKEWGRGRVTVLAFSLSDPALQQLPRETELWRTLLRLRQFDPNVPPDISVEDMQAQQLTQALYNLPALALPPLNVLAALLIIYIVLVGPVLYLLLRRLDRQAWAWVAIPALTVLFSAGTYGYGLRIRGNDVILNQISIVQPASDRARVRTYAGIFSPSARSYNVDIDGDALTRSLQFDPKIWGGEPGRPATKGQFLQGSSGVRNLEVAQWAMSTFAAQATLPFGPITARMELGDNVLRGVVRNGGAARLRDVALVQANRAVRIGDLLPGTEKPVELPLDNTGGMMGESLSMRLFQGRWNPNAGPPPPELRLPIQIVDSLYSYNPWARGAEPMLLGWLDTSPLTMRVSNSRVLHQQLTLVEVPVELSYGAAVTFPRGWVRAQFETARPEQGTCMTQWGPGALLTSSVLTATLRLPPVAQQLDVTKATIFTEIDGPPPDRVMIETYDWRAHEWTRQAETLGMLDLSDPARFIGNRELRVRLSIAATMMGGGCINVSAAVGGRR
ncbi:MAG: hypothetical protein M3380_06225 [Chloroflexota bacterium]|nr:hypothetical protein [Chloroflexota bacterium]